MAYQFNSDASQMLVPGTTDQAPLSAAANDELIRALTQQGIATPQAQGPLRRAQTLQGHIAIVDMQISGVLHDIADSDAWWDSMVPTDAQTRAGLTIDTAARSRAKAQATESNRVALADMQKRQAAMVAEARMWIDMARAFILRA